MSENTRENGSVIPYETPSAEAVRQGQNAPPVTTFLIPNSRPLQVRIFQWGKVPVVEKLI